MLASNHLADGTYEGLPSTPLLGQHFPAVARECVDAPPPLAWLLCPPPIYPAALFELVKKGIERGGVEGHRSARSLLDQLCDVVTVPRAHFDERKDEELGAALLQLPGASKKSHMWE
jgi:hypothetical protein